MASFFDELKKKNYERVLIITHAGVLRCVKAYMENLSLSDIFYLPIGFGEVYRYSL
ncbi:MAG: histidine phosphatase family protein [Bacteroidales bacterium]|nr:histidine phosphatase family protein [Bacteroidales bacterium]